jgi:hypothetical protein
MYGSRSKIPSKKSRPYIHDVKFLTLLEAPYIYDISRLRVKHITHIFKLEAGSTITVQNGELICQVNDYCLETGLISLILANPGPPNHMYTCVSSGNVLLKMYKNWDSAAVQNF